MKIKVSNHKLNIHNRGSPRGSRTEQHAYCLRYAHSQHTESHLSKKQQQAKIPIAFLFSQLHLNNVTSHALFYGGHLVMRSKRCAVQNQGNHRTLGTRLGITLKPFRHGIHLLCLDVCIIEALKQSLVYEYAPVNSKKISRVSNILQRSRDELFVELFEWEILDGIKYTYEQN